MSCRCSVCWNNPLWLKIGMYALKLSRDSLYLWVHLEAVLKTLGLITVLTVLYLTSARLSVWPSNLCEPMFLSRASKEYMALQYMAGPTEKGLVWPVTFCEPLLRRPQSRVSTDFQCASWQEDKKGQDVEDFHNTWISRCHCLLWGKNLLKQFLMRMWN